MKVLALIMLIVFIAVPVGAVDLPYQTYDESETYYGEDTSGTEYIYKSKSNSTLGHESGSFRIKEQDKPARYLRYREYTDQEGTIRGTVREQGKKPVHYTIRKRG